MTKTPTGPAPELLEQVTAGRLDAAILQIREVTAVADASVVDAALGWIDLHRWRATEATEFWVHAFFLLMRFGEARHLEALRSPPELPSYSQMHKWIARNRALTTRVMELRAGVAPAHEGPRDGASLPKTKAKLLAHIVARLGDAQWHPTAELVAFVLAPRFTLVGEEGLHIYAALLLHGAPAELEALRPLAADNAIIAQILTAHGLDVARDDAAAGRELLASIYAEPGDETLRSVYADWLMEQDDPRGEVIRAQLAGETVKIGNPDLQSWSGSLRAHLRWDDGVRFEGGFLAGASVDDLEGAAAEAPEWATVEVLDVKTRVRQLARYSLPSLWALGGLHSGDVPLLLASPLAEQLEAVGLRRVLKAERARTWDRLAELPRLRRLAVGAFAFDAELANHPLMERLELFAYPPAELIHPSAPWRKTRIDAFHGPTMISNGDGLWLPIYEQLRDARRASTD